MSTRKPTQTNQTEYTNNRKFEDSEGRGGLTERAEEGGVRGAVVGSNRAREGQTGEGYLAEDLLINDGNEERWREEAIEPAAYRKLVKKYKYLNFTYIFFLGKIS